MPIIHCLFLICMTNMAASSNFPDDDDGKTDEVVSAKMIPVVQGLLTGSKHIFSTPCR